MKKIIFSLAILTGTISANTYECTYTCRTDSAFMSSHTYKASAKVNASSESSAREVVEAGVRDQCRSMRDKQGNLMRMGSVNCN